MDTTNQETNESYFKTFEFELDNEIKQTYRGALKIFGSDPLTIKRTAKNVLILGILIGIISIKALLAFVFGFRINLWTFVFALGISLIYTSFYLKKNISKLPVIIVYEDKIFFKQQKYFTRLKILSFFHLFYSKEFESIDKKDIKNIAIATGAFNTSELIFETNSNDSDLYAILNVEKDYLHHIALYLTNYIKS